MRRSVPAIMYWVGEIMDGYKTKEGGLARIGIGATITTLVINLIVIFVSGIPGMYERIAATSIKVDLHQKRMDTYETRLHGLEESISWKLEQLKSEQKEEFRLLRKNIREDYRQLHDRISETMGKTKE